jgi:hypothetical protein
MPGFQTLALLVSLKNSTILGLFQIIAHRMLKSLKKYLPDPGFLVSPWPWFPLVNLPMKAPVKKF